MRRKALTVLCSLGLCACPPQKAPPQEPTATAAAAPAPALAAAPGETPDAAPPPAHEIPTTCASDGPLCVPDADFVKRFCDSSYPDVALVLMGKTTPFTRMYLKGDVEAWNAEGGASTRDKLRFDEEMLALKRRSAPKNSVVVGQSGGYLVMRWDGSCYTLEDGEVTTKKPPSPKHPAIPWRHLGERTKDALLANPKILAAFQKRGKECQGATSGNVSLACEKADVALSATIVSEIKAGLAVPKPERMP